MRTDHAKESNAKDKVLSVNVGWQLEARTDAQRAVPDFEAFLFRSILESWIGITEDALEQFDSGKSDYEKFIKANVCTLEPYLNPQWVETLKRISERELTKHEYKSESLYSLMEQDEADALLKNFVTGRVGETLKPIKG